MKSLLSMRSRNYVIAVFLVILGLAISIVPIYAQSGSATSSAGPSDETPDIGEQIEVVINIDVSGVDPPDEFL